MERKALKEKSLMDGWNSHALHIVWKEHISDA